MGKNKKAAVISILLSIASGVGLGWAWFPFRKETPTNPKSSPLETPSETERPVSTPSPDADTSTAGTLDFIAMLQRASLAEMPSLYETWKSRTDDPDLYYKIRLIRARWVDLDPKNAVRYSQENESAYMVRYLFEEWARIDVDAAVKGSQSLATEEYQSQSYQSGILAALAAIDSAEFLKWLDRLQPAHVSFHDLERVLSEVMKNKEAGKDKALGILKMLTDGPERSKALKSIASQWAADSPADAIEWALSLENKEALSAVLVEWGKTDPDAAGPYMKHITKFSTNETAQAIVREMAKEDPFRALRWLDAYANPTDMNDRVVNELGRRVPLEDVERFIDAVRESGNRQLSSNLGKALADGRSQAEIRKLLELAEPKKDDKLWYKVRSSLLSNWADEDPKAAFEYVKSLPGNARDHLSVILNSMVPRSHEMRDDFPRALEIAEYLPDEMRRSYLGDLLSAMAMFDPLTAVEIANREVDPAKTMGLHNQLAEGWAEVAPAEAGAWAGTLPDGEAKNAAFHRIADRWSSQESYATSEWVSSLEPGKHRDSAIRGMVGKIGDDDVDAAFQWLLAIEDDRVRYQSLYSVAYDMARADPDAGLLAIDGSSLSDKEKERMRRTIRQHLEDRQR